MLFLHEVHKVKGAEEDAFEASWRDAWMPRLADGDDARLLWYLNQAHGAGPSYTVITITALRDGTAWEQMARRVQGGDLAALVAEQDRMRHSVDAKLLLPVPWSDMQEVDLAAVPTDGTAHELSLYMEDTGWPSAPLGEYVDFWGRTYYPAIMDRPPGERLLDIQASFQVAHGAGHRPEAILMQKVVDHDRLLALLAHETAPQFRQPGTFMHDALAYRDQWVSRLLRTSSWSPLY
jgi:hypothetical protein